ncbi:hypothetical protein D3C81_2336920 [compost metagenome]
MLAEQLVQQPFIGPHIKAVVIGMQRSMPDIPLPARIGEGFITEAGQNMQLRMSSDMGNFCTAFIN